MSEVLKCWRKRKGIEEFGEIEKENSIFFQSFNYFEVSLSSNFPQHSLNYACVLVFTSLYHVKHLRESSGFVMMM